MKPISRAGHGKSCHRHVRHQSLAWHSHIQASAFGHNKVGTSKKCYSPLIRQLTGCSCKNVLPSTGRSPERWSDGLNQVRTERALSQLMTQDKGASALCLYLAFQLIKGLIFTVPLDSSVTSGLQLTGSVNLSPCQVPLLDPQARLPAHQRLTLRAS